jgi:hypothetical protein
MAMVGGITCTFVKGEAPLPKQRLVLWQVPGIDGFGAQTMGLGDSEFQFVCVYYGTPANVGAWARAIQAMQGQVVTVVNDWGTTYARCLLCRMTPPHYTPAAHQGGARGEIRIEGVVA